jgi:SPP1 family predicted phage head-tail adaptor
MRAGDLNRRVTVLRGVLSTGLQRQVGAFEEVALLWAAKSDVSDGERLRAGQMGAEITTRFRVRNATTARGITPADRLRCGGRDYDILGIKESDRGDYLELTARARADAALE